MKTIAVIFGGRSAEHDVSIITAHVPIIQSLLAKGGYDVWPIYISKTGKWYCDKAMNDIEFFKDPHFETKLSKKKTLLLSVGDGFEISWPGLVGKKVKVDLVFPAMHGTYGEDGSLMGLLRMAGVPFVGCDLFASAVAMDKVLTKQVVAAAGMDVTRYVWFTKDQWVRDADSYRRHIAELRYPLFVKPVHLGSSIGITKVKDAKELEQAIEVALHYDEKVLVEESVENLTEVTLPLMGNDVVKTAEVEQPLNKTEFFDFNDKYLSSGKNQTGPAAPYSKIPADIDAELSKKVKDVGKKVYRTLGCSGIARVDFLIDNASRTVYVNEVNTLPGTLYHHNWKKAGVSNMELVLELVRLAEERFASQKQTTYTFSSDVLRHMGGGKKGTSS